MNTWNINFCAIVFYSFCLNISKNKPIPKIGTVITIINNTSKTIESEEDSPFLIGKILIKSTKDKIKSNTFKEIHGEIQANKMLTPDAATLIVALSLKVFTMGKFEVLLENRKIKPVTKATKATKNTIVSIKF
ncbi:hypothetical protein [Thermoanaerobacter siderophilus]|uniref:hypothetical protein n=1 Tax=Thermoanaerobacter siderophilus TaxID=106578 RepID=UPI0002FA5E16|nr:hypothetical protein [Thermoanaerobacter siderophilus]